ncbi:16S rRNA (guanine(527)-N(7))-methyltransferase RsmG [Saccharicrinis sp. FJH2]|uniref:16S rRNA (guanine(527)-N(7))-methyltransferase RsmG n=1 Tax=unclassified Saccharicrinis TaxID=2646859 RepID=UPI0035D4FD32
MDLIKKYFPNLETEQYEKLEALIPLYQDWNTKINVVSRKDIDNLAVHHILHSLGIVKMIRFQPNTSVLDVGTGGGFPGIPLSIVFPRSNFHLIDSISKKIKVVQGIATELELANVRAEQKRVQQIKAKYEFVVSRAVTSFPRFVKMTRNNISDDHKNGLPNGIIYLKGGDFSKEISNFKDKVAVFKLSDYFSEEFFETKKVIYLPFA